MSGAKYLLDTNFVLGIVKGNVDVATVLSQLGLGFDQYGYSAITKMEALGFPGITPTEEATISALLAKLVYFPVTADIEAQTIKLRRNTKLKLPDAIIVATARVHGLQLLSLDKNLLSFA